MVIGHRHSDKYLRPKQTSVEAKMAAVHFTTVFCAPNLTAHKGQRKPHFSNMCPFGNEIVHSRFKDVGTLSYVSVRVAIILVR